MIWHSRCTEAGAPHMRPHDVPRLGHWQTSTIYFDTVCTGCRRTIRGLRRWYDREARGLYCSPSCAGKEGHPHG